MPIYLVGFSPALPKAAAALTAALIDKGATRLWDGLWSVDMEGSPHHLPGFCACEAAFCVPADAAGISYMIGRATSRKRGRISPTRSRRG